MSAILPLSSISGGISNIQNPALDALSRAADAGDAGETRLQPSVEPSGFSKMLGDAVDSIVDRQRVADQSVLELAAGRRDDISTVMVEVHKSAIALQLGLEVRNKLMDAYHEVTRMSV